MRNVDSLKNWQIEALQLGRAARHLLIQAPGGAGKSLLQVMMAQADIEDTGNKQLILVPKNHIHHGFFDDDCIQFTLPGESSPSRWTVRQNFCSTSKSDVKTKLLKDFLLTDVRQMRNEEDLAAIATHRALIDAWKRMSKKEKHQALRNISFRIDEAHHLSNVFHESDLDLFNVKDKQGIIDDATRLGAFVQYVLRHDEETVKVHLATATFFRGDCRTILSQRFKHEFAHYYLPWDEHFETLGIDNLVFDFVNYQDDPIEPLLKMVASEPNERHLVIIPALTHRFRTTETVPAIMKGLLKHFHESEVLDLVSPDTQEAHKLLLNRYPERFRAVVACRLFDEGTDWVPCTRMHNTDACETSVTLAVQRFFRPLRRHSSKRDVRIFNYLPDLSPDMTDEDKRRVLSNRLNAILACIVTQGELVPCMVPVKNAPKGEKPRKAISLQEVLGHHYTSVMDDLLKGYERIEDKSDAIQIEALVERVTQEYELPDDVEAADVKTALLQQVIRIANPKKKVLDRKALEPKGIDAEAIRQQGFDKVWKKLSPVESLVCNGTDNIDAATVRQLLSIVNEIPGLKEIDQAIRVFHARTGKRPTFHQSEWLKELDRSASAVDKVLRRHHGMTLAERVREVLGDSNDDLIARTHDLIREYWSRGIRIGNKFGDLPEIGISSFALNGRLTWNHNTTLAKEVEKVLGPNTKPLTLANVRKVIREYQKKGIRLHRKFGRIPELDMSSHNLADRLKRNFDVKLSELVDEVAEEKSRAG